MITITGASKKAIACQSYPILAIFADFQGLFWSTYRYRKILSRIVLEPTSKNSPERRGSVWPNGNINIQISWKTAFAGKFARRCRYELRGSHATPHFFLAYNFRQLPFQDKAWYDLENLGHKKALTASQATLRRIMIKLPHRRTSDISTPRALVHFSGSTGRQKFL